MFYFTSTIIYITAYNALKMCDIHYLRITKLLYKRFVDDFALGAEQFVVVCMLKKIDFQLSTYQNVVFVRALEYPTYCSYSTYKKYDFYYRAVS